MGPGLFGRLFGAGGGDPLQEEAVQSPFRTIVRNFVGNKVAMAGLIVFVVLFLCCFILPIFYPLDVTYQDVTQQNVPPGFSIMDMPGQLQGNVVDMDAGSVFGIGVGQDGQVYVWGQLDEQQRDVPQNMGHVVQVSAGLSHFLALNDKGEVFTWGYNRQQLDKIPFEVQDLTNIKQIEAGHQISMVLTEDGELYTWGNENVVSVSVGEYQGTLDKVVSNISTALGLTKDGRVVSLSTNETPFSSIPEEIQGQVVDLAVTDKAAAAITSDGQVVVWGSTDDGVTQIPQQVQGNAKSVSAGRLHFTVLTQDGQVFSWGGNQFGQANAPQLSGVQAVHSGYYQNYAVMQDGTVNSWGLKGYLMGTDGYGRDVFLRLISGGRLTMTIGAISVIISTILGVIIGGIAGYYGGWIDNLLMRFTEIVMSIPFLPLAMILSAIVGNQVSELGRISLIMVILGVLSWPGLARLVRAQILAEREKEFVTAARAMGIRQSSIIFRHILPNVITVVIVNTTLNFATCLLTESSLSFLGFGVVEPSPTWGNMLTGSQSSTVIGDFWWRWVFPAVALSLATISINLVGDGLRDAIDPKSNER
ncbi:MAG TPA: ABC transporter permease subunit [Candidatus Gallacutalibacter stercoravium]|nr:ABC transporter permease subunit [Candidatus Gallacutalibacter stercoravium]